MELLGTGASQSIRFFIRDSVKKKCNSNISYDYKLQVVYIAVKTWTVGVYIDVHSIVLFWLTKTKTKNIF